MKYLIQQTPVAKTWLDGFDALPVGDARENWEWTRERKTAWRLGKDEAERRLKRVRLQFPEAMIVEA